MIPQLKNPKNSALCTGHEEMRAKNLKEHFQTDFAFGMVHRQIDREIRGESRGSSTSIYICMQNMLDRRLTFTNDKHLTNKMLFLCLPSSCVCVWEAFNVGFPPTKRATRLHGIYIKYLQRTRSNFFTHLFHCHLVHCVAPGKTAAVTTKEPNN